MINLLPHDQDKTFWNPNTTFLDIYCKSGVFLEILYRRLMGVLANFPGYEDEQVRSSHILNNQLFGLSPLDDGGLMLATRRVYGDIFHKNLIHYDIQNVMKDISSRAGKNFELYEQNLVNTLKQVTNKEFNKMNFNVVIGNPPYNRGGDIDFVNLSYEIQTDFVVMITPAKWQTAEDSKGNYKSEMTYSQFREKLVPHMREVVFYPDQGNVFDISQVDGITCYLMDKCLHDDCKIRNVCNTQKYFNSVEIRDICHEQQLNNIGDSIINYLGRYDTWKFEYNKLNKKLESYVVIMTDKLRIGGRKAPNDLLSNQGSLNCLGIHEILLRGTEQDIAAPKIIFSQDSKAECEYFVSWLNTKFTRFFVAINISKLTGILTNHCFRFVPSPMVLDEQGNRVPGKFDHIYTDEELYKTWNLPQKYIDVIEAVIKERK